MNLGVMVLIISAAFPVNGVEEFWCYECDERNFGECRDRMAFTCSHHCLTVGLKIQDMKYAKLNCSKVDCSDFEEQMKGKGIEVMECKECEEDFCNRPLPKSVTGGSPYQCNSFDCLIFMGCLLTLLVQRCFYF